MRKASKILFIIGIASSIFSLLIFVLFAFVSFTISGSGYTSELIKQLQDGSIKTDYPGTVAEQAAYIQHTFLIMAIIFLVISILILARVVIAEMARRFDEKKFYIISIVVSVIGGGILVTLASIFGLVANKQETQIEEINTVY